MDWEFDILYAIQSIRTPFLDKVMAFLSTLGNAGVLWIVIGVVPVSYTHLTLPTN